jgi:hypothetical protein
MARSWLRPSSLLGSLVLGSACGPLVVLDDGTGAESFDAAEASDGTGSVDTTTVDTTTVGTSSTTSATTTTTTATTTPMTTVDPTGNEPGYCAQACFSLDDCLYPGSNPADWACTDGFCEFVGMIPPCDPQSCDYLMIGFCTEIDGVSVCATPCNDDSSCVPGFTECSGHDDAGNSICEAIPCFGTVEGEPCEIDGFGQIGVCIDGVCACTDDSQCTAVGYACDV